MRSTKSLGTLAGVLVLLVLAQAGYAMQTTSARDKDDHPTLTVSGEAEVEAKPDRAAISLGAEAQADTAQAAQDQVNQTMQRAIEAIREAGIPAERISTAGVSLWPVYSHPGDPRPVDGAREPREPRIVGYRASNTVQVQVEDLSKVGPVIDAGVRAGANRISGVSFELKDDTEVRSRALRQAVEQARTKAEAIAPALNMSLGPVESAGEGGVQIFRPQMAQMRGLAMADAAATPIEPGQIRVHASVNITYRLTPQTAGPGSDR